MYPHNIIFIIAPLTKVSRTGARAQLNVGISWKRAWPLNNQLFGTLITKKIF